MLGAKRPTQFNTQKPLPGVVPLPCPEGGWELHNAQVELARRRQLAGIAPRKRLEFPSSDWLMSLVPQLVETQDEATCDPPATVTVHPSIVTTMLTHHLEATGRVYLLLRHIDHRGQGWLAVEDIRQRLTAKVSSLRLCGWRRLRQILAQGEGVFWHRDRDGRVWLVGAHKIAYKLGMERLQGFLSLYLFQPF